MLGVLSHILNAGAVPGGLWLPALQQGLVAVLARQEDHLILRGVHGWAKTEAVGSQLSERLQAGTGERM